MATIAEIIAGVDDVCPNSFSSEMKTEIIGRLDGEIYEKVYLCIDPEAFKYVWPECAEWTPLVRFPYDDIYGLYLKARIEFNNGEYEKYNNTNGFYEARLRAFTVWYINTYNPAQTHIRDRPRRYVPDEREQLRRAAAASRAARKT
jgi:hypothetical protein